MKQIPALIWPDGTVLCESLAISLALAEAHPESRILVHNGTPSRALVYRWLMHILCKLNESDLRHTYPARYTTVADGLGGDRLLALWHAGIVSTVTENGCRLRECAGTASPCTAVRAL